MDPRLCNSSSKTSMYSHYHHIKIQPQAPPPPPRSASCNMHISKCASAQGKTPPAQVAMAIMSASGAFALVDGRKNTTSASCTVSRPSWAQVYRSGMQQPNAGSTRAPPQCKSCPCATCIWLLHLAPIDLCPRWS